MANRIWDRLQRLRAPELKALEAEIAAEEVSECLAIRDAAAKERAAAEVERERDLPPLLEKQAKMADVVNKALHQWVALNLACIRHYYSEVLARKAEIERRRERAERVLLENAHPALTALLEELREIRYRRRWPNGELWWNRQGVEAFLRLIPEVEALRLVHPEPADLMDQLAAVRAKVDAWGVVDSTPGYRPDLPTEPIEEERVPSWGHKWR